MSSQSIYGAMFMIGLVTGTALQGFSYPEGPDRTRWLRIGSYFALSVAGNAVLASIMEWLGLVGIWK